MAVAEVGNNLVPLKVVANNNVGSNPAGKKGDIVVFGGLSQDEKPEIGDKLEVMTNVDASVAEAEGYDLKDELIKRRNDKMKELKANKAEYEKMEKRPISWENLGNAMASTAPALAMLTFAGAYIPMGGAAATAALVGVGGLALAAIGGLAYLGIKEYTNRDTYKKADDFHEQKIVQLEKEIEALNKTIATM